MMLISDIRHIPRRKRRSAETPGIKNQNNNAAEFKEILDSEMKKLESSQPTKAE